MLNLLSSTTPEERAENPRALVLAPTRELAMQIETQAKEIMKGTPTGTILLKLCTVCQASLGYFSLLDHWYTVSASNASLQC